FETPLGHQDRQEKSQRSKRPDVLQTTRSPEPTVCEQQARAPDGRRQSAQELRFVLDPRDTVSPEPVKRSWLRPRRGTCPASLRPPGQRICIRCSMWQDLRSSKRRRGVRCFGGRRTETSSSRRGSRSQREMVPCLWAAEARQIVEVLVHRVTAH